MFIKYFSANKALMNSNQQTHQAMQGKYSNYQVSATQSNQLVSVLNSHCVTQYPEFVSCWLLVIIEQIRLKYIFQNPVHFFFCL